MRQVLRALGDLDVLGRLCGRHVCRLHGSVQCDFRHCVDRDSALCVISDNLPAVSSTKSVLYEDLQNAQFVVKPILSYRAVARCFNRICHANSKSRDIATQARQKPRKDGVRFFILLEGESFCIGTFRTTLERPTVRSCLSAKLQFCDSLFTERFLFSCAVQRSQLAESLHQARHKDDAERHRARLSMNSVPYRAKPAVSPCTSASVVIRGRRPESAGTSIGTKAA